MTRFTPPAKAFHCLRSVARLRRPPAVSRVDPTSTRGARLPRAREQAGSLEAVERRVDRALGQVERAVAAFAQRGDHRVAVGRSVSPARPGASDRAGRGVGRSPYLGTLNLDAARYQDPLAGASPAPPTLPRWTCRLQPQLVPAYLSAARHRGRPASRIRRCGRAWRPTECTGRLRVCGFAGHLGEPGVRRWSRPWRRRCVDAPVADVLEHYGQVGVGGGRPGGRDQRRASATAANNSATGVDVLVRARQDAAGTASRKSLPTRSLDELVQPAWLALVASAGRLPHHSTDGDRRALRRPGRERRRRHARRSRQR